MKTKNIKRTLRREGIRIIQYEGADGIGASIVERDGMESMRLASPKTLPARRRRRAIGNMIRTLAKLGQI